MDAPEIFLRAIVAKQKLAPMEVGRQHIETEAPFSGGRF